MAYGARVVVAALVAARLGWDFDLAALVDNLLVDGQIPRAGAFDIGVPSSSVWLSALELISQRW